MREIKLRAWDGEKMVCPDYINRDGHRWWKENSIPTRSEKVMQFTGLKDKKGKEIYEGDILLHSFHSNYIQESLSSKQVVQWHEDCCGFGLVLKILAKSKNIEVIGNIYENPELLEVE